MDEKERITAKIREGAESEEQARRCLELLQTAYSGLAQGLAGGVSDQVKTRLDDKVEELERAADAIESRIMG
jgi:hypothetical protein